MGINLLQDRETTKEDAGKKKSSQNFELTKPAREKDEVKNKIKQGGLIEFFKNIFKQSPKIRIQSEEEVIKDVPEIRKASNKVRGTSLHGARYIRKGSEPEKIAKLEETVQVKRQAPPIQKVSQYVPILKTIASSPLESKKESLDVARDRKPLDAAPSASSAGPRGRDRHEKQEANEMASGAPKTDSDSLNVNLIPEEIRIKLEPRRKLKVLILAVGLCLGVILLLWGGMIWRQRRIQKNIQEIIASSERVEQEITAYDSVRKIGEQLNSKISQAEEVLNSHVYWTKFLAELENYTLPDVYYQNMAASLNGTVTLSAVTKDLPTLAKQYQVMQNASQFIKSVVITAAAIKAEGDSQEVTFNITLTVDPAVFYQQNIESLK